MGDAASIVQSILTVRSPVAQLSLCSVLATIRDKRCKHFAAHLQTSCCTATFGAEPCSIARIFEVVVQVIRKTKLLVVKG